MKNAIELKINGEPVRLNPFVQKAFLGVIAGFIQALDGIPRSPSKVEIKISREAPQKVKT